MNRIGLLIILLTLAWTAVMAQDTVDITFRYRPPTTQSAASLVGEFNGWNNTAAPMTNIGNNTFTRTVRLLSTGAAYTPGAYQYKFYYSGVSNWPNDPLNPRFDPSRNNNSIIAVRNPTIYQLATDDQVAAFSLTALVRTKTPVISAYIFPKVGSVVDTAALTLRVDTTLYTSIGHAYDFVTKQFQFQVPAPLANGTHKAVLTAGPAADSVTFTVQAGFVQITTRGGFSTRWSQRTILGAVEGGSIDSVKLVRNGIDSIAAPIVNKTYTVLVPLVEGMNTLRAVVRDSLGGLQVSDPITITRIVDHAPIASARALFADATTISLTAANSSDPDSQTITYEWRDDPRTPLVLTGQTGSTAVASKPTQAGEYFFGLIVRDPNGNADTTTAYHLRRGDGRVRGGDARDGRL